MRQISENDVRRLLPMREAIETLRRAFAEYAAGKAVNQPRRRLFVPGGAVLHSLAASYGAYFGTKVYATHVKHGAWFTVLLFDAATAEPLAQIEANWLGQIRTGAVSGLAADLLLPEGAATAGCIGTGFQARSQLEALAAVRPLREVRVWSRRAERRDNFADEMSRLIGCPVFATDSAEGVAAGASVLVTATFAKDPVIRAAAVEPGTLVLAMGSNNAQRRELPGDLVQAARIVVEDTEACRVEAGDLLLALDEQDWDRVVELKSLVAGAVQLPPSPDRVTVFKSVGLALEDVAVAASVYERSSTT